MQHNPKLGPTGFVFGLIVLLFFGILIGSMILGYCYALPGACA